MRRAGSAGLVLGLALALSGCSATGVLNALSPGLGQTGTTGVAYEAGANPRQRLDVYAPAGAHGAPVVVFLYGGSWQSGSRGDYAFVGRALASRGFVAVVPDYRVYPEVRFPGFVEDAAAAVAWARAHAAEFGGDPRRIVLAGHSAGAHVAALVALDPRWLGRVGLDPRRDLAGWIGLAGPYDFLPLHDPVLQRLFTSPLGLAATQPINEVRPGTPPALLATDRDDSVVEPGNTARLAARLRAAHDSVRVIVYPGLSHETLIGAVAAPLQVLAPVLDDMAGFIAALPARGR